MSVAITNVLLLDNVDPSAKVILEENGIKATLCKDKLSDNELIEKLKVYFLKSIQGSFILNRNLNKYTEDCKSNSRHILFCYSLLVLL